MDRVSTKNVKAVSNPLSRGVAQPGRAPGSGPGGRRFKSSRPDHLPMTRAAASRRLPLPLDTPRTRAASCGAVRIHRLHLLFRGRVQGVGFRWFVSREARRLEIAGRVWNRGDGAVEVEAEGSRVTLEEFLGAIGKGPSSARVQDVTVEWSEGEPSHRGFEAS